MLAKPLPPFAIALMFWMLPCAASAQEALRFTIDTPTAKLTGAGMVELSVKNGLHVEQAGEKKSLPGYVEIRQDGRPLSAILTRNVAVLTSGDRIPLDASAPASLKDGKVKIWPDASLPAFREAGLTVFAPTVVFLLWTLPEGVDDAEAFSIRLSRETRPRDVLYLRNGDRIEGTLVALDAKAGCTIDTSDRKLTTPWDRIAGIAWNTERQARPRIRNAYARAVLAGGARLNFLEVGFDEKTRRWKGKTQFGAVLDLPEADMLALQTRQAHAVDLSDLPPKSYEQRPYLGVTWPLALDVAADGRYLCVAGNTFEKGLGTHAPCRITYALDGKYQRFDALVGINELTSRRGRAKIALEIDGKRIDLNNGKELTAQTPPVEIHHDLRDARTLTLIVELGSFGDVQANVNWANARLIKRE